MGDAYNKVLNLIGGHADSAFLKLIINMVESQLLVRIGGDDVPFELQYVVVNVSVARYNQIGDEGKSSVTIEGESASWLTDLFAPYEKDIQAYMDSRDRASNGVRIRFL